MGAEPAEQRVLRTDRIYTYDEFAELRSRFGGRAKGKPIITFRKRHRVVPFVLRISYQTAIATGIILLIGSALTYGILSTTLTNKSYNLSDTKRSIHNLGLALASEKSDIKQAQDKLIYDGTSAKTLGLALPTETKFIVRTNIKPVLMKARTVKDLYPLSDKVIEIDP